MISKKGIAIGQVFIFMVAGIIFALILIFGYRSLSQFMESGEKVEFTQFKTDLESSIKKIYTEYGSARKEDFYPPPKYEQICFVDMDASYDPGMCDFDPLACDVWQEAQEVRFDERGERISGYESVEANVFLQPLAPVPIKVYKISIAPEEGKDYLCLEIKRGSFSLYLEGKGDHTQLSRVSD